MRSWRLRTIVFLLRLGGGATFCAFFAMFLPVDFMESTHNMLGSENVVLSDEESAGEWCRSVYRKRTDLICHFQNVVQNVGGGSITQGCGQRIFIAVR